jgi:hypothetical protein
VCSLMPGDLVPSRVLLVPRMRVESVTRFAAPGINTSGRAGDERPQLLDLRKGHCFHLVFEAAWERRARMVGAKLLHAIHFGKARTTLGNPSSDTSPLLTASCRVVRPI